MSNLKPETREKLKTVSTPTLMTALYKRGLRQQWVQDVHCINPAATPMVGEAFTLRYMPAREDLNPIEVFRDRDHPQRAAVEQCPPGAVFVIDSRKDPSAASAGSILVSRLMVRGCAGIVTDGGFRDTLEIAKLPFPAYHNRPSAPTNLTLHQAIDINVPIGCGDAPVFPGDVMVGDAEGVVVIPAHLADELADETGRDDGLRGFRHRRGHERPLDPRALSRDRSADPYGLHRMAERERALSGQGSAPCRPASIHDGNDLPGRIQKWRSRIAGALRRQRTRATSNRLDRGRQRSRRDAEAPLHRGRDHARRTHEGAERLIGNTLSRRGQVGFGPPPQSGSVKGNSNRHGQEA